MIHPIAYIKPRTVEEALSALDEGNARALAGGTDLLVDMRNGVIRPDLLVDIKGLSEVQTFSVDSGVVKIGAGVPLNDIIENRTVRERYPVLCDAAFSIATCQLRNRATLAGNICNASPAADMLPPLFILGAVVVTAGREGERKIPIKELVVGVKKTSLRKGELVVRVEIPPAPGRARMAFLKKQRVRGHDLAVINVAGFADRESGRLCICVGACAETPVLLTGTDELYSATGDKRKLSEKVSELSAESISPIDDVRASAEYRRDMVRVYVKRLVEHICSL